jgi:predicted regulator of Ras-like GTPase activity (Roadblock/LC7/MglB family)
MLTAPEISDLLARLLTELMDGNEDVLFDTSIITTDGVILATTAADRLQVERVMEMAATVSALAENLCDASQIGAVDGVDLRISDENSHGILYLMVYPRKWGAIVTHHIWRGLLDGIGTMIVFNNLIPRALKYIDHLFETHQEPPPFSKR